MRNKKLSTSLNKFYKKKEDVQELLYGELGIPLNGTKKVDVPGRPGYVYVRLRGNASELIQAYNSSVPSKYDYPVIVLRKKNTYTILGKDQRKYSNLGNTNAIGGYTALPNHGGQHSFNPSLGMGADPVWVWGQQFMPQLAYPSGSSMVLAVSPHFYEWDGQWKYSQSTGTPSFSPYVPSVTGSARMALLHMDGATSGLQISAGSLFSGGINSLSELAPYIPDIDRNKSIPLAAVKLVTGTTAIEWSNIYDVRDFYTVSKYFQGIGIQDGGTPAGTGHILNFGNNLAVSFAGNIATIDATAGGGGGIGFVGWNEGVLLGTGTVLNFVGEWVDASISGTVVQVRVTGSASAVPITDSGGFFTGTSVESALAETQGSIRGRFYVPFGIFTDIAPFTAVTKLPYAATIDRAMTLIQWVQGCRVAGTSDSSNYWTIDLKREYAGAATIIATITTQTVNSTDWKNITTDLSNYAIDPASNATILYLQVTTKTGAPGNLYLSGVTLEAKI